MRSLTVSHPVVRHRLPALPCWLLLLLASGGGLWPARGQTLATLLTNGPTDRRINLVILSEGYKTNKLGQFATNATDLINQLLGAAPFNQYRSCFNAFTIAVASNENGSDHPSQGTYADTYFNTSYDSNGNPLFINLPPDDWDPDPSHGLGRVTALLSSLMPAGGVPILLVNDLAYGGSGGSVLICSRAVGSDLMVTHEMGHTLAGLGDEYQDPYPGYPDTEESNTTRATNLTEIKWNAWINAGTQVPTSPTGPQADRLGLFEGAHYHATGWYRPRLTCRMRDLTQPFCEVCQEALVLSLYRKVRPIQSWSPIATNVLSMATQTLAFTVTTLPPPAGVPVIQWWLDNTAVAGATQAVFQVSSGALSNGLHQVRAEVRDATTLVRTDPDQLLSQTQAWQVQVSRSNLRLGIVLHTSQTGVSVLVDGTAIHGVVLEASTNLLAWQPVATNAFSRGHFEFQELSPPPFSGAYYRARALP